MANKQVTDIQQWSNGYLPDNGQVFIGEYGSTDPYNNQINIIIDDGTTYSGQLDLSQNGRPLDPATGVETQIYVDDAVYTDGYSLQISDADGNYLYPNPVQVAF